MSASPDSPALLMGERAPVLAELALALKGSELKALPRFPSDAAALNPQILVINQSSGAVLAVVDHSHHSLDRSGVDVISSSDVSACVKAVAVFQPETLILVTREGVTLSDSVNVEQLTTSSSAIRAAHVPVGEPLATVRALQAALGLPQTTASAVSEAELQSEYREALQQRPALVEMLASRGVDVDAPPAGARPPAASGATEPSTVAKAEAHGHAGSLITSLFSPSRAPAAPATSS